MTPSEQRHRRHWDLMTYPERLRFITSMFANAPVGEIVWCAESSPFGGLRERRCEDPPDCGAPITKAILRSMLSDCDD
jgi:hypothetical protein